MNTFKRVYFTNKSLLFALFFMQQTTAMDIIDFKTVITKKRESTRLNLPTCTLDYFELNDKYDREGLKKLLASFLVFDPQKTAVIAGTNGMAYRLPFKKIFNEQSKELLFTHRSVAHSPLIIAHKTEDEGTMIISAGNYFDQTSKKWMSELILFKNRLYSIAEFKSPIQAIKINGKGNLLIIAQESCLILYDLIKKKIVDTTAFQPAHGTEDHVIDIALDSNNSIITSIGKGGIMQLNTIFNANSLCSLKRIGAPKNITNIQHPTPETILYSTKTNTTGMISLYDILEEQHSVDYLVFSRSEKYQKVVLNTGNNISAAYWTKKYNKKPECCRTIKIYQLLNKDTNERKTFTLKAPVVEGKYEIMSKCGQLKEKNEHFSSIILCDNYVAALSSCGKIFVWDLLAKNIIADKDIIKDKTIPNPATQENDIVDQGLKLLKKFDRRPNASLDENNSHPQRAHHYASEPSLSYRRHTSEQSVSFQYPPTRPLASTTTLPRYPSQESNKPKRYSPDAGVRILKRKSHRPGSTHSLPSESGTESLDSSSHIQHIDLNDATK